MTEPLRFLGGVLQPASTIGQVIRLTPGRSETISYESEGRAALDFEMRASFLECEPSLSVPLIRVVAELSHGLVAHTLPPARASSATTAGAHNVFTMPQRGMTWRFSARNFRISFQLAADSGVLPAVTRAVLQASIQPAIGPLPSFPQAVRAFPFAAGTLQPFPQDAREWCLRDRTGLPLADGALAMTLQTMTGLASVALDPADFAEWGPIPHDWIGFVVNGEVVASYR